MPTPCSRLLAAGLLAGTLAGCAETIAFDGVPPGPPADLAATAGPDGVALSWTLPRESGPTRVLVVRYPAAGVDGAPEAGRGYAPGDSLGTGVAIYSGAEENARDVPQCTEHVYAGWTQDAAGNWSLTPEAIRLTGFTAAIPAAPADVNASLDGRDVRLSWSGATDRPGVRFRVVRKEGIAPMGPSDGTEVSVGTERATSDRPELSPDRTLHYGVYACTPCDECEAGGDRTQVTPTLVQALRSGGFVVYWRHATASVCADRQELGFASNPTTPDWWKSCSSACGPDGDATARQLSPAGLLEAEEIGRVLRERDVPFDRMFVSEYCRCQETAQRIGLGTVVPTPEVTFFVYQDVFPDRCAAAKQILTRVPQPGTNNGVIAHLFAECANPENGGLALDLVSGEAAVFRPDGRGGLRLVDRVAWDEWADLP